MPAKSEKQRKFMGAELARKRAGKATQTDMTEEQLEDFASKQLSKISVGARVEGVRPRLPDHLLPLKPDHELPRKKGQSTEYPPSHGGVSGPHRELRKEQQFLKWDVNYNLATPEQIQKGEQCDTCMYWKDGGACHLVIGFIHGDMWCNKWEQNEMLQGEHPIDHLQRSPSVQRLQKAFQKEDGGGDGGGALAGGGTVFTSTNAGVFTPTHGGNGKDKKVSKKKTGIERLGQFITDNSPEKKMIKSSVTALTNMLNEIKLELRKEDAKKQTPPHSKSTQDDPPQVVERETDIPDDPSLVSEQNMTMKEQKRIMNSAWASAGKDWDSLHMGGKKDKLESDETRNEPEKKKLPFSKRFEKALESDT